MTKSRFYQGRFLNPTVTLRLRVAAREVGRGLSPVLEEVLQEVGGRALEQLGHRLARVT